MTLDMTTLTIMSKLPREVDPTVFQMLSEDPGDVSFNSIGGLSEEIRELREVCVDWGWKSATIGCAGWELAWLFEPPTPDRQHHRHNSLPHAWELGVGESCVPAVDTMHRLLSFP